MPVFLKEKQFARGSTRRVLTSLVKMLEPAGERVLACQPVSKRVNSSRADGDDATLIDEVAVDVPHDVGNMRANGVRALAAWCSGRDCHHSGVVNVERYGCGSVPVPWFRPADALQAVGRSGRRRATELE